MSDNKGEISITGVLAIGNGEKCPFCDMIKKEDTDIFAHLNDKHKKEFNKALFNE